MRRIEEFCCQNIGCPDHGKKAAGNLRVHGWSSKKQGIRTLVCRTCGEFFSERKGTALWHSRLPQQKALEVLEHISEGCGVRQTARLTKVAPNTVCRLTRRAGVHADRVHDELVALSPEDD